MVSPLIVIFKKYGLISSSYLMLSRSPYWLISIISIDSLALASSSLKKSRSDKSYCSSIKSGLSISLDYNIFLRTFESFVIRGNLFLASLIKLIVFNELFSQTKLEILLE